MNTLTIDDVRKVAEELLKSADKVSTVEIKNQLRNEGFYADQQSVSDFMKELTGEEVFDVDYSSGHREYSTFDPNAGQTSSAAISLLNHNMLADDKDDATSDDDDSDDDSTSTHVNDLLSD